VGINDRVTQDCLGKKKTTRRRRYSSANRRGKEKGDSSPWKLGKATRKKKPGGAQREELFVEHGTFKRGNPQGKLYKFRRKKKQTTHGVGKKKGDERGGKRRLEKKSWKGETISVRGVLGFSTGTEKVHAKRGGKKGVLGKKKLVRDGLANT